MDAVQVFSATAHCHDLPELVDRVDGEISLAIPTGDLDRIALAVAARRQPGAVLQEKIDGCWCVMQLNDQARVASVTSRSGLHLRVAVAWLGEQLPKQLAGLALIGEVEAGTHWSSLERQAEAAAAAEPGDVRIPRLHLYAAMSRAGDELLSPDRVRKLGRWISHPRLIPIREAAPGEDWASFTRSVMAAGGEGVVIREASGRCWRAKPTTTIDRYASKVYEAPDRNGELRTFVALSAYVGRKWKIIQTVLAPEEMPASKLRNRVVVILGASLDPKTGVMRHARIAQIREEGDKTALDCTLF